MFSTCAVVSVSCKARLTRAGVVLFRAAADGIFVAGEGERRAAHVWDIQRNKYEIYYSVCGLFLCMLKSWMCYRPCSKHLYPCLSSETVLSGHSAQVNWGGSEFDLHCTPRKQGLPRHTSAVLPQIFPLNPFGHRHPTTWEEGIINREEHGHTHWNIALKVDTTWPTQKNILLQPKPQPLNYSQSWEYVAYSMYSWAWTTTMLR